MPLTPSEFRDALTKGTGRAVAYVRNAPAAEVREALLDACLHCKAYDAQCEGMRVDWLYHLIELSGEPGYYRQKISEALPESRNDEYYSYDYWAMYGLMKEFAMRGDDEARTVLYREFDRQIYLPGRDDGLIIVLNEGVYGQDALLDVDGMAGLLYVVEAAGRRILAGLTGWPDIYSLVEEAEERFGEDFVRDLLEKEAEQNEFIRAFWTFEPPEDAYSVSQSPQKPFEEIFEEWLEAVMADTYDDPKLLEAKEEDMLWLLSGRHVLHRPARVFLNDAQIDRVWEKVLAEENPYRLFCLLRVLACVHKYRLPYAPKILALVDSSHRFLRWIVCNILSQVAHPAVRQKALELLQTVPSKVNWYAGIELLASSFQPEDSEVIDAALEMHEFPDIERLHGASIDLCDLAETYPEGRFAKSLRWFFEHAPSSLRRHSALEQMVARGQTTREMLEECLDDCDEQIRELAAEML